MTSSSTNPSTASAAAPAEEPQKAEKQDFRLGDREEPLFPSKTFAGVPFDPRFPHQNQTANCFQNYLDFHRCVLSKGEGFEPCNKFKTYYLQLCPDHWVEKWDEQIEQGISPFPIDPEKAKKHH